jgi:hypothetical protein
MSCLPISKYWVNKLEINRISNEHTVELATIIEDQEVRSKVFTNAEVLRPSEVPNEHMPYPQEFLGIQNISPLVKDQSLVKAPKHHDIQDLCTDPGIMLK